MAADLVVFVRARLDEDEAAAGAASPGPWHVNAESDEVLAVDGVTVADGFALSGRQLRVTTAHIARHDPARVLAEVEAKRRIVDLHPYTTQRAASSETSFRSAYGPNWEKRLKNLDTPYCETCDVDDGVIASDGTPCETLRLLALPYADYPDYWEEWRP